MTLVLAMISGYDAKSTDNKSKNRQVGQHLTQKFLRSKGNSERSEKTIYGIGENTCK